MMIVCHCVVAEPVKERRTDRHAAMTCSTKIHNLGGWGSMFTSLCLLILPLAYLCCFSPFGVDLFLLYFSINVCEVVIAAAEQE